MTTETPTPPVAADPRPKCPSCGNAVEPRQPFCLECGRRLALDYRKPPSFRVPLALVVLIVIAAGVAAGYAVTQATNDDHGPDAITVGDPVDPGLAQLQKQQQEQAARQQQQQAQGKAPSASTSKAPGWPAGRSAYTVVLLTTKDKATANATAQKAIADGIDAGVLKGADFQGLPAGSYFVFSGQYDSTGKAKAQVAVSGCRASRRLRTADRAEALIRGPQSAVRGPQGSAECRGQICSFVPVYRRRTAVL